jgi:hypothetical protein
VRIVESTARVPAASRVAPLCREVELPFTSSV